jgi:hypothetical protein
MNGSSLTLTVVLWSDIQKKLAVRLFLHYTSYYKIKNILIENILVIILRISMHCVNL